MKLVAMLRIKNSIITINECLTKLSELVDEIIIVDNGSTDGTLEIYKKFPKIKIVKKTKNFDEGRDKCLGLKLAKKLKPDWILWIDGDEIFEKSTSRKELNQYINNPKINLVKFRIYNFWLSKNKFRIDNLWHRYTSQPQRQMWRNLPRAYFRNLKFHNGGIMGIENGITTSHIRIKHYGYIDKKQINTRKEIYSQIKNNDMNKKTLPMDEENIKLLSWIEFNNKLINKMWQITQKLYWGGIEIYYRSL